MFSTRINGQESKISFKHERETTQKDFVKNGVVTSTEVITPYKTICLIETPDHEWISEGHAACGPKDRFEYEKGRKISLTRAINRLGLPREDRQYIWDAYFSAKNHNMVGVA